MDGKRCMPKYIKRNICGIFKFQVFILQLCLEQQSRPVGNLVQGQQFRNNSIIRNKK